MLKNLSKPMQLLLVGALALVAFVALQSVLSPDTPAKTSKKTLASKPKPKTEQVYTAEDMKARFDSVSLNVKDSFKPEIIKLGTSTGKMSQVNLVPLEFAGGEANWAYTGSAEIDGVLQALLENKATGEDVFLKVGDSWKGVSVEEITDDSLLLASTETGTEKKLELPPDTVTGPGPAGFAPARVPGLQGNIGPMTLQPDGSAGQPDMTGTAVAPADTGTGGFGGNGGRTRGRGRNRGGGGAGFTGG